VTTVDEHQPLLYPGPEAALTRRLGRLTLEELHGLEEAVVRRRAERPFKGRVDRGFWFAWHDGLNLSRPEQDEIQQLFSAVMVAISVALTGLDVERFGARLGGGSSWGSGGGGGIGAIFSAIRSKSDVERRQETAIGLIHDATAPWNPRLALMACWNVTCAAAVRRRVKPQTVEALEVAWRDVLGEPPA
jgi:hypothetical protein